MKTKPANESLARLEGSGSLLVCACCAGLLLLPTASATASDEADTALAAVRAAEASRVEVFARAARAVVSVFSDDQGGGGGSGVLIDPRGYGLTNFHVVQPFVQTRRGFGGLSDGKLYPLKVLGIDPGGDIAMFKLEVRESFDYAPLGDSDTLRVGQWVAAMGNPFLLAEDFSPTVTLGVVSGLHRYQRGQGNLLEYADCIQVSTSINPGNSGGPLFDLQGRVIGINGRASFEERGRVNVGLGFAVSINQIKRFIPGLRAGRLLKHGTLGATVRAAGGDLIVSAIQAFSPAEQAGVQLGDELLEIGGRPVRTSNDYNNVLAIMPADWPVTLHLRRDGRPVEVTARLERLALRVPLVYVPDLEHNHGELAKILDRHAQRTRMRISRPASQVTFKGRITSDEGQAGEAFTVVVDTGIGEVRVADAQANADVTLDSALQDEWRQLALPLLAAPQIDLSWELLAGDEVRGRIANVIERRFDTERRIRWKFDWQTDELLQVTIGSGEEPETVAWSPGTPQQLGEFHWPRTWKRRSQTGEELVLQIESVASMLTASDDPAPNGSPQEAAE